LVETYEVPLLGKTSFLTNEAKRADLVASSKSFLAEIELFLSKELLTEFNIVSPKVIESDIASGDQFISNKLQSDIISEGLPTVKCVEMEGAAVAQVCFEYNKPFSIIRTISDNANNNAHVDFPKFAHEIASKYALGILKNYLSIQ
jgi:adenosylhomocysteine nucleosidase